MKFRLLEQQQHCRKIYGRYFYEPRYILKYSAGIISACFVYMSELNDYECNDCTTIVILSALHMF